MEESAITIPGEWKQGKNAGGCINNPSVHKSPQYFLYLEDCGEDPVMVTIELAQGVFEDRRPNVEIGALIADKGGGIITEVFPHEKIKDTDKYVPDDMVSMTMELVPKPFPYTVLAATYLPGDEQSFTITARGPDGMRFESTGYQDPYANLRYKSAVYEGRWEGVSAGGSANHPSVGDNPQFYLTIPNDVPREQHVALVLQQVPGPEVDPEDTTALAPIGVMVLQKEGKLAKEIFKADKVAHSGDHINFEEVRAEAKLQGQDNPYTVLVSTFHPGTACDFRVWAESDSPLSLTPANDIGTFGGAQAFPVERMVAPPVVVAPSPPSFAVSRDGVENAFAALDDGSGTIDIPTFVDMMTTLGDPLSAAEVDEILMWAKVRGEEAVSLSALSDAMCRKAEAGGLF